MVEPAQPRRRWWRRHPVLAGLGGLGAVVVLVVLVLLGRALLVLADVPVRAGYWQERARTPVGEDEVLYVALGDSLSQGIGSSSPRTTFVDAVAGDLEASLARPVRVVNLSVTGARTDELVAEQLPRLRALLDEAEAGGAPVALVTLCIGANDAGSTAPEEYRTQLRTALAALPPGSLVCDVPDFNGGPRLAAARELSAVAREEVTARDDLVLVEVEAATADLSLRDYAADFFHPSDRGYARYVAAFRDALAVRGPQPTPEEPAP